MYLVANELEGIRLDGWMDIYVHIYIFSRVEKYAKCNLLTTQIEN